MTRRKYYFCWWCSRQLWAKRAHVQMRPGTDAANENANTVTVHRGCGDEMESEGWEFVIDAVVAGAQQP